MYQPKTSQVQLAKPNQMLDYSYYQHALNNLKSTMSPEQAEKVFKQQQVQLQQLQTRAPHFQQIGNIYPYITLTNNYSFNPFQPLQLPVAPIPPLAQPRVLRNSSIRPPPPPPKPNLTMLAKIISPASQVTTNRLQQTKMEEPYPKSKLNKQSTPKYPSSSEQAGQIKFQVYSNDDREQESNQNNQQQDEESNCLSSLSSQNSEKHDSSESSNEDDIADQGTIKFFPMEQSYLYFNDDREEEIMAQYRQILKSILAKGFGLKAFGEYVKENKAVVNPDLFFQSKLRYYRRVYFVTKKIIQSIQYFLCKDCGLKIRKINLDEYKFIRKYMLHYKRVFKKRHIKTMEKIIKVILNLEDVTLTQSKVKDLHQMFLDRIDKKLKQDEGIKRKARKLSEAQFGAPYTLRRRRQCEIFYKDKGEGAFQDQWKASIQKQFIQLYKERGSWMFCHQKLCLLYPKYKKHLSIYNLKCSLQRIYRIGFGNLLARIKSIGKEKLPRLSPVSNFIFKRITLLKNYQKARFSLIRLYQQEQLKEETVAFYIHQLNQCLREFQGIEGLILIKRDLYKKPEMNVISLRPRFIVRGDIKHEHQQKEQEEQEQKSDQGGQVEDNFEEQEQDGFQRQEQPQFQNNQ